MPSLYNKNPRSDWLDPSPCFSSPYLLLLSSAASCTNPALPSTMLISYKCPVTNIFQVLHGTPKAAFFFFFFVQPSLLFPFSPILDRWSHEYRFFGSQCSNKRRETDTRHHCVINLSALPSMATHTQSLSKLSLLAEKLEFTIFSFKYADEVDQCLNVGFLFYL